MRTGAKVFIAAMGLAAGAAWAGVLYVEVPPDVTKKDFINGLSKERRDVRLITALKEAAYKKMKEINNPAADYIVGFTKDGVPLTGDEGDRPRSAGPEGFLEWREGSGWPEGPDWWPMASKHIEGAYELIKRFYGNPFNSFSVEVEYDPEAPNPAYFWPIDNIVLNRWGTDDAYATLTHEMVHPFHDSWMFLPGKCIEWDQFEEGFCEAIRIQVQNLMYEAEPFYDELWHESYNDYTPGDLYDAFYHEFHFNQNQAGLATHIKSFYDAAGGPRMTVYRYKAAGFAWWKVLLADENFLREFNARYYVIIDPGYSGLQNIAIDSFAGGLMEGKPFDEWLYAQPILNLPPEEGTAMFTAIRGNRYQVWLYQRFAYNPLYPGEIPIVGARVDFVERITGRTPPLRTWTEYTNDYGGVFGYLSFPDMPAPNANYRVRLHATAPEQNLERTSFGWATYLENYPPDLADQIYDVHEIYGCTTVANSGTVYLAPVGDPDVIIATVPVVHGGFHVAAFTEPEFGPEVGADEYVLTLVVDGETVKTTYANKDADDYFVVINDADPDPPGALKSAVPPALITPFAVSQNIPNPCVNSATINLSLPSACKVEVAVYDLAGRRVGTSFEGSLPAGSHAIAVNTSSFPSGVYLYRVTAGPNVATKKLVVAR